MATVPLVTRSGAGTAAPDTAAPRASRLGRPSWLDPRLVVGIVLIVIAVLGGARVVAGAGHTTEVWSLRHDLGAGAEISSADLVATAVHFTAAGEIDRYLPAGSALPPGARVSRSVGSGELLPRTAVSAGGGPGVALPLEVESGALPPGLRAGTVVDVWAVPTRSGTLGTSGATGLASGAGAAAVQLLSAVPVAAVAGSGSLGTAGTTVVTVSIPRDPATVAAVLGRTAGSSIVLLPVSGAVDSGAVDSPATTPTPAPAGSVPASSPTPAATGAG